MAKVRCSLIKSDIEVAYIEFNGTGSNRDSWFDQSRTLSSTWSPSILTDTLNPETSLSGYAYGNARRPFYFYGPHNQSCTNEYFYTWIWDSFTDKCRFEGLAATLQTFPMFFYSTISGPGTLGNPNTYDNADAMAVYVMFTC
ncbi:hypothetical protein RRG08_045826 [Elysia crispata]|uniref:Uncharacterized protein n=1 Tax=Elysia crispata TaxID=231223 RepID=A0AAE1D6W2_9GAST|nr:hypothetical protein RRG08_045826 [Elysia crispata]